MDESLQNERRDLNRLAESDYADANRYMVLLNQYHIIISAIILLVLVYLGLYEPLIISFDVMIIMVGLSQFCIDYLHSKKWGDHRQKMANNIADGRYPTYADYYRDYIKLSKVMYSTSASHYLMMWQCIVQSINIVYLIYYIS